jgi:hypothetical protein
VTVHKIYEWLLAGLSKVGLASNLFAMPEARIKAAQADVVNANKSQQSARQPETTP